MNFILISIKSNIKGAPRIGQSGPPPPGYRGPSRGNPAGSSSQQNQAASALLRMGVPPPRGSIPSIPHGSSSNSSSPMGMVSKYFTILAVL